MSETTVEYVNDKGDVKRAAKDSADFMATRGYKPKSGKAEKPAAKTPSQND